MKEDYESSYMEEKRKELEERRRFQVSLFFGVSLLALLIWGLAFLIMAISWFVKPQVTLDLYFMQELQSSMPPLLTEGKVFPKKISEVNEALENGQKPLSFQDVRDGILRPNYQLVQWILAPESFTNDQGTYLLTNKINGTTNYAVKSILDDSYHYTLFDNSTFALDGTTYTIDSLKALPDLSKAILKTNTTKGWRHSSFALYWVLDVASQKIEPLFEDSVSVTSWSPTSDSIAFVYENNVYVRNLILASTAQITSDGSENIFYGKPDWVYEEEVFASDIVLWWSPKGDKLSFLKFNDTLVPEFTIPYYVQDGYEDYPELVSIKYPKPGYPNPTVDLIVIDLAQAGTKDSIRVADLKLTKIQQRLITEVLWVSDDYLMVKTSNRASDILEVFLVSSEDNAQTRLIRSYHAKDSWFEVTANAFYVPKNISIGRMADGYVDLVVHEGYNHLAYFSPPHNPNGVLLTQGQWEVLDNHLDYLNNEMYFVATRKSSVERHIYSVNLLDALTSHNVPTPKNITDVSEDGWYSGSFSSGSRFLLLNYQGPGIPTQRLIDLHSMETVKEIENNEKVAQAYKERDIPQSTFTVENLGKDEETGSDILANAIEILPLNFDPKLKYPVLFYVYGGPGSQMVTKEFAVGFSQVVAAELNAVVVTVDGRGTGYNNYNQRLGSKFKFTVRDRLGHFEPIDQIAAAKIWAKRDYVDPDRIAIWGWSYGGFLTLKTLETDSEENVFSYGVAIAPVTKWKLYDSIYTERYLRTPQENPQGYETASIYNITNFENVTRFLMMHGSGDDNVHFQNSLRLVDEFNLAGVENFDFMVFPDSDHLIRYHNGNKVVYDRILGWFRRAFNNEFVKGRF